MDDQIMKYDIVKNGSVVFSCNGLGYAWKHLKFTPEFPKGTRSEVYMPEFERRGYQVVERVNPLMGLDEKLSEAIKHEISKMTFQTKELTIKINDRPAKKLEGFVHVKQTTLIKVATSFNVFGKRLIPYLYGPAGSGKTEGAAKLAEALELEFYAQSFHPFSEPGDIFGYVTAMGDVVMTPFREAYTNGGVYLADEMDAASGRVLTAFNMALAQNSLLFPAAMGEKPEMAKKHKDFVFVAAGNTTLTGGNAAYSGRQELDAATIQRLSFIEWTYDLVFEEAMAIDKEWLRICWTVRKNIARHGLDKFVISVRNIVDGDALLASGFSYEEAIDMRIAQGASQDIRTLLLDGVNV